MKKVNVYIIFGVLIASVAIVIFLNYCSSCKQSKKVCIVSEIQPETVEKFGELVYALQPQYTLGGFKGRYEPVPDGEQPINGLPFNVGLKPCNFTNI